MGVARERAWRGNARHSSGDVRLDGRKQQLLLMLLLPFRKRAEHIEIAYQNPEQPSSQWWNLKNGQKLFPVFTCHLTGKGPKAHLPRAIDIHVNIYRCISGHMPKITRAHLFSNIMHRTLTQFSSALPFFKERSTWVLANHLSYSTAFSKKENCSRVRSFHYALTADCQVYYCLSLRCCFRFRFRFRLRFSFCSRSPFCFAFAYESPRILAARLFIKCWPMMALCKHPAYPGFQSFVFHRHICRTFKFVLKTKNQFK